MRLTVSIWNIGSLIAAAVSYNANRDISWAILHGIGSWLYLAFHFWK